MSEDQQQSIINALKALPLRPDARDDAVLQGHARIIETYLYRVAKGRWKQSTMIKVVKELDEYSDALEVLTQKVKAMSPRALGILQAVYKSEDAKGKFRREPERIVEDIIRQPEPSALGNLPGCLLPNCHKYLLHAAKRAVYELRDNTQPEPGRQPNAAARWLACRLAETYFFLTDEKPTRRTDWDAGKAYGPFLDFVSACFKMTELKVAPVTYARFAVENFEEPMD
jgi:hypothetical protein